MIDTVFILAGGSGTRLWPASTRKSPKQLMQLRGDKSLLELTLERALAIESAETVYIITLKSQLEQVLGECGNHDRITVLPEPAAHNTAPAIALAATAERLKGRNDANILVLTADHLIEPVETFVEDAAKAGELAEKGFVVTFGIPPHGPSTGYGYIETAEEEAPGYRVASFKEKPDRKTAEDFVAAGNFYWNSGMFAFKNSRFLEELKAHQPAVANPFEQVTVAPEAKKEQGISIEMEGPEIEALYDEAPEISIDYAVMEKSKQSAMVKASFTWTDIGSWDEVARLGLTDNPDLFESDASGNFVYSDLPVAICGVDDVIVVVKNGCVLVCRKGSSQKVKQIVTQLKDRDRRDIL